MKIKIIMVKEKQNWNKADKDGNINVPDYLDGMVNKVGNQFNLVRLSGKNEIQAICDITRGFEKFYNERNKNILQALIDVKSALIDSGKFKEESIFLIGIQDVINKATKTY